MELNGIAERVGFSLRSFAISLVFSNMREKRMNIDDFGWFNYFSCFNCLG
jgi:hypothetical protein